MKELLIRVEDGAGSLRSVEVAASGGSWLCGSVMRLERGSDRTADPYQRPSRIVIETYESVIEDLSSRFAIVPLTAPSDVQTAQIGALQAQVQELAAKVARLEVTRKP